MSVMSFFFSPDPCTQWPCVRCVAGVPQPTAAPSAAATRPRAVLRNFGIDARGTTVSMMLSAPSALPPGMPSLAGLDQLARRASFEHVGVHRSQFHEHFTHRLNVLEQSVGDAVLKRHKEISLQLSRIWSGKYLSSIVLREMRWPSKCCHVPRC